MLVVGYLLARDPALLKRRMRTRETEPAQGRIVWLGSVCYLLTFLVPGIDRRFAWSSVPAAAVMLADVVFLPVRAPRATVACFAGSCCFVRRGSRRVRRAVLVAD